MEILYTISMGFKKQKKSCENGSICGSKDCKRNIYVTFNGAFGVEHHFTCKDVQDSIEEYSRILNNVVMKKAGKAAT